jgi:hypothetical protein
VEKEKIGVGGRLGMRGLKNKGIIEISQDTKKEDYVLVISKGIQRKWLMFNFPEEMWRVRCSKEEVLPVVNDFLNDKIMVN